MKSIVISDCKFLSRKLNSVHLYCVLNFVIDITQTHDLLLLLLLLPTAVTTDSNSNYDHDDDGDDKMLMSDTTAVTITTTSLFTLPSLLSSSLHLPLPHLNLHVLLSLKNTDS